MRSRTCCGPVCTGVDRGPSQLVAEVEVGDEPVPQILGGEIVQRCPDHGSCDRDDVMSLVVDFSLYLLRRPNSAHLRSGGVAGSLASNSRSS